MFFTLIVSDLDPASRTMLKYLQEYKKFVKVNDFCFISSLYEKISVYESKKQLIYTDYLNNPSTKTDVYIFLSKHQSKSRIPSLTCHFPGNFFSNSYGGNKCELGISYPSLQKYYLKKIYQVREKVPLYDITIETTHHGPTNITKPVMFVEIGSDENQWINMDIASIVCDSLLDILPSKMISAKDIGIGLGGNHYGPKFNKLILDTDYAIGHIANKYNLTNLNNCMLNQMILRSYEKVTHIIIDQKGLGNEKQKIMQLLQNTELELIKI
jgi:D-aminoacyl-tRNA deacylase